MQPNERNVVVATVGLAATAVGAFLPWARIGGRNRSGFNTADTFIGLAKPLPDAIAWVGRWWYLPALLAVLVWGSTFFKGRMGLRIVAVVLVVVALVMWWLFVWAGRHYGLLNTQFLGPVIATAGLLILGYASSRRRASLLSA